MTKVKNAIILAAGMGERAVPMTYDTPKGLFNVHGAPMIERQIEQLLEKSITEIIIVVGYLKEKFDYLIDKYGVELVYNPEFVAKNNLASVYCVKDRLDASYLLMSDNFIEHNIFSEYEDVSWFSCPFYEEETSEWVVSKASALGMIEEITIGGKNAHAIQGPAYFSPEFSRAFKYLLEDYYFRPESRDYYWEHVLKLELDKLPPMQINDTSGVVYEFENIEELRKYDNSYMTDTNNEIMRLISRMFKVPQGAIHTIQVIKTGMNNSSFKFSIGDKAYIFRQPGADTGNFVNRDNEKKVYEELAGYQLTDHVVYFDGETGVKISEFLEDTHDADPYSDVELKTCMEALRILHNKNVQSSAAYDIENKTKHFINLAKEKNAIRFSDFDEVTEHVNELYALKETMNADFTLCHGDYAHVNVLILPDGSGRIIDLEFCGVGDPIMDVAMYGIFAYFDHERLLLALQYYLGRSPTKNETLRMYLYVSISAFLWVSWAEFRQANGAEFGDYTLKMYRYVKDYYTLCIKETNT